jgi:hypothetical protein
MKYCKNVKTPVIRLQHVNLFFFKVSLLDRKNPELLILVTSFLKKLACYSINKEEMKVLNAADKLAPLLTIDNPGHFC